MAGLLSIGISALTANQTALNTVSHNIANANTPGYSRQSVVLSTAPGQLTGAGYVGHGVNVTTVQRAHDDFLTREANIASSQAAQDSTLTAQLNRLQRLFPTGTDGIGSAASQFLNSLVDVASNPSDLSARQVVLGNASELASRFSSAGQQLDSLQSGVVSDLQSEVATVNQLAQQIAAANDQIAKLRGSGQSPNDLLDQRDKLIADLSTHIAVTTLPADDGSIGVFVGGGQRLVLGSNAESLHLSPDAYDPAKVALSIDEGGQPRSLDQTVLTGGNVTALLSFQNKDLVDARNLLGQMAAALGTRVNQQNALGLDLSNPPVNGVPIFNVAGPRVLSADTNQRNAAGNFVNGVQATIVDATQLQASDYKLAVNPAGGYTLTRLSDGTATAVNAGSVVDGFQISFSPNPPTGNDSYIIEPVGAAAANMRRTLDAPAGIAAASPVSASVAATNTGTLSVTSVFAVNSSFDPAKLPISVNFGGPDPANPGQVLYTLNLPGGVVLNGSWAAGQPIGNQPNAVPPINLGFELSTNGVPRNGDVITLQATTYTKTNNGNAKAFLKLQTDTFVGRRLLANGSLAQGASINDAYATAMSDIGTRLQGAAYLSNLSTAKAAETDKERNSQAGVNLDEEASRLIQYQQAYQAAAKVMQTAQSIFNSLLQIAGG